jgi:hypothetical protein
VVHVSVIGVRTNAESEPGEAINIGHMPFAEDAARRSVGRRLATGGRPDENFELGYAQWRSGQGGVFTITISQAVALALGMMSAPPQPAVTASR